MVPASPSAPCDDNPYGATYGMDTVFDFSPAGYCVFVADLLHRGILFRMESKLRPSCDVFNHLRVTRLYSHYQSHDLVDLSRTASRKYCPCLYSHAGIGGRVLFASS